MDLPTPLTPTMEMMYGRGLGAVGLRDEGCVTAEMECRRSREVVGVRILWREEVMAARIVVSTPGEY